MNLLSILNLTGRRRLQQIQLVKGPNRILLTLEDLTFINPQLSRKVSSNLTLCNLQSVVDVLSTSIGCT